MIIQVINYDVYFSNILYNHRFQECRELENYIKDKVGCDFEQRGNFEDAIHESLIKHLGKE